MPLTQPMDEELRLALPDLTRAERQLASHILTHYPVAALSSITALAKAGGVSSPTVVRLVQKLGYQGYSDFQRALRGQVEAMLVSPLVKLSRAGGAMGRHLMTPPTILTSGFRVFFLAAALYAIAAMAFWLGLLAVRATGGDVASTACDAPPALQETCNGVDDDCNLVVDDLVAPTCTKTKNGRTCTGPHDRGTLRILHR